MVELATLSRAVQVEPKKKVNDLLEFQAHMITAYADGSFCVFDAQTTMKHSQPPLLSGACVCLAGLLESGPRLLCAHAQGEVSSIALPAFELSCYWKALDGVKLRCLCAAGHDGIFIVGTENGELQVWQRSQSWVTAPGEDRDGDLAMSAGEATQQEQQQLLVPSAQGDGAPKCAGGHLCAALDFNSSSEQRGWRCAVCGAKYRAARWFCSSCSESLCFECFPRREQGREAGKEAITVDGSWVHVRKHSSMGCAVVTFKDASHRDLMIERFASQPLVLGGLAVDLKPHHERQPDGSREEVADCAFAGWKQPKELGACRLNARALQAFLDRVCASLCPVIALD